MNFIYSTVTDLATATLVAERANGYGWMNQVSFGCQPEPSLSARVHELEGGFAKVSITWAHDAFKNVAGRLFAEVGIFRA